MDFSITEDQQSLQKLVGEVLADNATHEHLKELEAAGWSVFDRTLWRQLAQAGVTGIAVPETAGGAGLGFLEVGLVLEQIGRAVAPVPAAASLVTGYVFGKHGVAPELLAGLAAGDVVLTTAFEGEVSASRSGMLTATRAPKTSSSTMIVIGIDRSPASFNWSVNILSSALPELTEPASPT